MACGLTLHPKEIKIQSHFNPLYVSECHSLTSLKVEEFGSQAGEYTFHTIPMSFCLNYVATQKISLKLIAHLLSIQWFDGTARNIVKDNEASTPLIILLRICHFRPSISDLESWHFNLFLIKGFYLHLKECLLICGFSQMA